jgi:hypothetical protein
MEEKKIKKLRPPTDLAKRYLALRVANPKMSKRQAALQAGYGKDAALHPRARIESSEANRAYLREVMARAGIVDPEEWIVDVLIETREATALYGKDSIEHPDYKTRLQTAETVANLLGYNDKKHVDITSDGRPVSFTFDFGDKKPDEADTDTNAIS